MAADAPQVDDTPTVGPSSSGWRSLEGRIRRLDIVQLLALLAVGAAIVVVAIVVARAVNGVSDEQSRFETHNRELTDVRQSLRVEEARFWQYRARGGPGLPPETRRAAVVGQARVAALASSSPHRGDPELSAAQKATLDQLASLVRVTGAWDPSRISPGSPREQRLLARTATTIDAISQSFARWVARDAAILEASRGREARQIDRMSGVLIALVAALVVTSLALWTFVRRGQRRMVGDLDDAAQELANLAATDALTGLANHGEFHARLDDEVARARRHGRSLSLVLVDIDHFKQINDARGHQIGDLVLAEIARRLATLARTGDLVGRVGGEEFGWLLPETAVSEAFQAAERARRAVRSRPIEGAGGVTVSVGVAGLSDAENAEELYRLADSALYWAKAHGRDVTFRYSPHLSDEAGPTGTSPARAQAASGLLSVARAVDARAPWTHGHADRVAARASDLASALGMTPDDVRGIREVALLHEIGRTEGLGDDTEPDGPEWRRAAVGAAMLRGVVDTDRAEWLRTRYEQWDGDGGPDGLSGADIPLGAQILAVADTWDELTAACPPADRLSPDDALDRMRELGGSALAPHVVEVNESLVVSLATADSRRRT